MNSVQALKVKVESVESKVDHLTELVESLVGTFAPVELEERIAAVSEIETFDFEGLQASVDEIKRQLAPTIESGQKPDPDPTPEPDSGPSPEPTAKAEPDPSASE